MRLRKAAPSAVAVLTSVSFVAYFFLFGAGAAERQASEPRATRTETARNSRSRPPVWRPVQPIPRKAARDTSDE